MTTLERLADRVRVAARLRPCCAYEGETGEPCPRHRGRWWRLTRFGLTVVHRLPCWLGRHPWAGGPHPDEGREPVRGELRWCARCPRVDWFDGYGWRPNR